MKRIAYTGPSWAVRSFDHVYESDPHGGTNLAKELNLEVINLSQFAIGNQTCYNNIKQYPEKFDVVLWVYCEPFVETPPQKLAEIISADNFWDYREKLNQVMLKKINNLGCPVGLIGGHSDISNCDFENIQVIHPSWQKFLAKQANIELEEGWGAEVAHGAMIHNKHIKPSRSAVERIWATLNSWKKLESFGLFKGTHPSFKGNQIFAKEIETSVKCFIDSI